MSEHVYLLLHGYIDGELDIIKSVEIEDHLKGCSECSQQYEELLALRSTLRQASLFQSAPRGLEKRVKSSVRKANHIPRNWFSLRWQWIAAAVFLIGITVLGVTVGQRMINNNHETRLAEEVQSAHVRSLMAAHLTDITSTDQHTVKPWFNGKLDFSPPVVDLAAQGFPLIGGRLDFIGGRPVAALVYQRNKHDINLFVWPSANRVEAPRFSSFNGYNIYHWTRSGMDFWTISDLNPDELMNFVMLAQENFN